MKRVFITMLLLGCIISVNAQIRSIPSEVTDSFKVKFPNATKVTWKDNLTNFEAEFTNENTTVNAKFGSKGDWMETDKKLEYDSLSKDVKDGFHKSKYSEWEIRGVKEINEKGKEILYRILIRKSDLQKKYLYFNKSGQLKKEATTM